MSDHRGIERERPFIDGDRMTTDEAVEEIKALESEAEAESRIVRTRESSYTHDGIAGDIGSALDTGLISGVGIVAVAGTFGYGFGLIKVVSEGYADESLYLEPAMGVFGAITICVAGALLLGYNIGWQAEPEVDD